LPGRIGKLRGNSGNRFFTLFSLGFEPVRQRLNFMVNEGFQTRCPVANFFPNIAGFFRDSFYKTRQP